MTANITTRSNTENIMRAKASLKCRISTLHHFISSTPNKLKHVCDKVHQLQGAMTFEYASEILDMIDNCIIGFEEIAQEHLDELRQVKELLESAVMSHIERRKTIQRIRSFAASEDDIEAEIPATIVDGEDRLIERESVHSVNYYRQNKQAVLDRRKQRKESK